MSNNKKKVMVFCAKGRFQYYLLHCIQRDHELVGVVYHQSERLDQTPLQRKLRRFQNAFGYLLNPLRAVRYIHARLALPKFERQAEHRLQAEFPLFSEWQNEPQNLKSITVDNINASQAVEFVGQLNPDVVCVNGTNLIREPLLSIATELPLGIINLHTGLSPYSRGGNCNLFMLLENKPQFVGGTVHYIDKGIDSGDIIHSFQVPMLPDDTFEAIDGRVFLVGMHALNDAVAKLESQQAPRVKQWQKGKLFLLRTGYKYEPALRLKLNKMIEQGLIERYLQDQQKLNKNVRLIS